MRRILALIVIIAVGVWACAMQSAASRAKAASPAEQADLKDTLEKGLLARRPEEIAFVAKVVAKVNNGTLPRSLVTSTFQWARQQPTHPFQHFEQGLKERAKQLGISL